ncbi:MAG TPA: hypothetical protein DCP03_11775 [Polaromonas sp.]|uniref:L,D-transpeptidase n=1 Tax=Polaromonas sp. UBA4122 TaxID=1947074 RepID=UPI000EB9A8EF|nr:L,D-transpeptidase [Polaromonas sp. UBA4122]HAL38742.1 hypothetical protein [Polaromonas sp.]
MPLFRSNFLKGAAAALVVGWCMAAHAFDPVADMSMLYSAQVDRRLSVPAGEARHYGRLAEEALAKAGMSPAGPEYLVLVDRDPNIQALFLFFRPTDGESQLVGASPVSTGRPGSLDHFETPLGVFEHSTANPDFRAEGTRNSEGIQSYGVKGMRVYDFGWQQVPKGWGSGTVSTMRLQMHATDPDLLERRLGSAQSKGCIRIPASLNRLIDRYGVLDADYERAQREGSTLWVLDPQREPVPFPGRYLIVVDSGREDRPEWSPRPYIPHRKPAAPAAR